MEHRPLSVGDILRRARTERGLSLADAEAALHVRARFLEALEMDDFAALPPTVYTRALVREYGRYLGLDPVELLERAVPTRAQDRNPIRPAIQPLERTSSISFKGIATVIVISLFTGLLMYLYAQYNSFARSVEPRPIAGVQPLATPIGRGLSSPLLTPMATLTAAPPPTPAPTPTLIAGLVVETRLVDRSWVQVWADSQSVLAENISAGTTRVFTADDAIRMRVGNAGGVEVTVNGQYQGRLGPTGQALDVSWGRQ